MRPPRASAPFPRYCHAGFTAALDAREAAGETMDNTLIRIEEVRIHSASLDGRTARIALLFVADIAAVTRDKDGTVIAGSLFASSSRSRLVIEA